MRMKLSWPTLRANGQTVLLAAVVLTQFGCATDPIPPRFMRIDMPDEGAASVLGRYMRAVPSEWHRGVITISPCSSEDLGVECDFYVHHRLRECEFGAYLFYFPASHFEGMAHYKTVFDERARACASYSALER